MVDQIDNFTNINISVTPPSAYENFSSTDYTQATGGGFIAYNPLYVHQLVATNLPRGPVYYTQRAKTLGNFTLVFKINIQALTNFTPCAESLTLTAAPGCTWAAGNSLTGQTSGATATISCKVSNLSYYIINRTGTFVAGELVSNGTCTGTLSSVVNNGCQGGHFGILFSDLITDTCTYPGGSSPDGHCFAVYIRNYINSGGGAPQLNVQVRAYHDGASQGYNEASFTPITSQTFMPINMGVAGDRWVKITRTGTTVDLDVYMDAGLTQRITGTQANNLRGLILPWTENTTYFVPLCNRGYNEACNTYFSTLTAEDYYFLL